MKKVGAILLSFIMIIGLFSGCSKIGAGSSNGKLEESQVRSICELATLKCYYHNVAKLEKSKRKGLAGLFQKERTYWIDYSGYVKIGVDMSKVQMKVSDDKVSISMPKAKVLSIAKDDSVEPTYYISEDGMFVKNTISAKDQSKAIKDAQNKMKKSASKNTALLTSAQDRAKEMIESYVKNMGEITGHEYEISWE